MVNLVNVVTLGNLINLILLIIPALTWRENGMKAIKISEDIHSKLTGLLGELTAQTNKMQTYQDAINALINESVILPQEVLAQIQSFIEENKHLGFTTKEEFIRDAIRFRLRFLKDQNEFVEIPKEVFEKLQQAIRDMDTPFQNVNDFIDQQIANLLEKYASWIKQKEDYEKRKE